MLIEVSCPTCSRRYKLDEKYAGRSIRCASLDCGSFFLVPLILDETAETLTATRVLTSLDIPVLPKRRWRLNSPRPFVQELDDVKPASPAVQQKHATAKRSDRLKVRSSSKLVVVGAFLCAIGLVGFVAYMTKYGRIRQEPVEKFRKAATGSETARKKDGSTLERRQPKR